VSARRAFAERLLPIGLATRIRLRRPVAADALLTLDDVELEETSTALALRAELRPSA
jgi:predicted homoserine dehydrogenase-like protein